DRLYVEALSDPELRRTRLELDAALANAEEARKVVFELFQDLDRFTLDEFKPLADVTAGLARVVRFLAAALPLAGERLVQRTPTTYDIEAPNGNRVARFTTDRDEARADDQVDLLGLDHEIVLREVRRWQAVSAEERGAAVRGDRDDPAVVTVWLVETHLQTGGRRSRVQTLAVSAEGRRIPSLERRIEELFALPPAEPVLSHAEREGLLRAHVEPMLLRELEHRGEAAGSGTHSADLLAWIEVG
ncbi:MAG TPA: helicase, partial [Planctomycetota bacterium]|nr:helicase [Planctomycetota bacterium]